MTSRNPRQSFGLTRPLHTFGWCVGRARSVLGIVALVGKEILGCRSYRNIATHGFNTLEEARKLDIDNLTDVIAVELVEDDDIVDTIEELGCERLAQRLLQDGVGSFLLRLTSGLAETETRPNSLSSRLPTLEVMMMMVFLKSTMRPRLSVR